MILELTIVNLLMNSQQGDDHKMVYLAPTKALCTEKYLEWKAKFTPLGVRCAELTGDTELSEQLSLSHVDLMQVFLLVFVFVFVLTSFVVQDHHARKMGQHDPKVERLSVLDEQNQVGNH